MKETILEGDYILSTKYDYGFSRYSLPFSPNLFEGRLFARDPAPGDVVIMRPPHDMETRYIKRLIGMPGDKIEVNVELITPIAMEMGLRFAIREGGRTVGAGVVTEIVE